MRFENLVFMYDELNCCDHAAIRINGIEFEWTPLTNHNDLFEEYTEYEERRSDTTQTRTVTVDEINEILRSLTEVSNVCPLRPTCGI